MMMNKTHPLIADDFRAVVAVEQCVLRSQSLWIHLHGLPPNGWRPGGRLTPLVLFLEIINVH